MKRSLLILAALLAACSEGSSIVSIRQNQEDQNEAAVLSASDATVEDVGVLYASDLSMASTGAAPGAARAGWTFDNPCTYVPETGRFTCPPVSDGGLTLTRDYAFFDAGNHAMSAFDQALTASANFHVAVTGVHTAENGADTVSRDRSMTVAGLAGTETSRSWNGTGTRSDGGYRNIEGVIRRYHTNDVVTFTNIVVSLPRAQHRWPVSGSITRQLTGTGSVVRNGVERSFSVSKTVTITFDGTQYATVTVGGESHKLDLATGRTTRN